MLTSSLDRSASIFLLPPPPSADCVLHWTAISSRLFSSAFLCELLSLSSLRPLFPPPLSVLREISPSTACVGFAPKQTKGFSDRHPSCHSCTAHLLFFNIVSVFPLNGLFFQFKPVIANPYLAYLSTFFFIINMLHNAHYTFYGKFLIVCKTQSLKAWIILLDFPPF